MMGSIRIFLSFNKVPNIFIIYSVFQVIKILNYFPVKGGIYDTIIPTTIMTGESLHKKKRPTDWTVLPSTRVRNYPQ